MKYPNPQNNTYVMLKMNIAHHDQIEGTTLDKLIMNIINEALDVNLTSVFAYLTIFCLLENICSLFTTFTPF